jgi:mRNA interferase HigB
MSAPDLFPSRPGHRRLRLRSGYHCGNLNRLRIISKVAITEFSKTHRGALEPLLHWYSITKRAAWNHLVDVRADFPHADAVDAFTVFNISGNKYRLISVIKYRWQIAYIRHILTHAEYDKGKWKL